MWSLKVLKCDTQCMPQLVKQANSCSTGWSKQDWQKVQVLLKCGTGKDASSKQELQVKSIAALCPSPAELKQMSRSSCHCIALSTCAPRCNQIHCMFQDIWPHLTNLKWIHSASAGVEKLLFPELVKSDVVVTNAKVTLSLCKGATHAASV